MPENTVSGVCQRTPECALHPDHTGACDPLEEHVAGVGRWGQCPFPGKDQISDHAEDGPR